MPSVFSGGCREDQAGGRGRGQLAVGWAAGFLPGYQLQPQWAEGQFQFVVKESGAGGSLVLVQEGPSRSG